MAKQSLGVKAKVHADHEHRAVPAAEVRRRQPARPHRQQRRERDRHQHDPQPALRADRRHRREQLRGQEDRATPSTAGVTAPGTLDGKFLVLNYVLTVYALWYSQSLFDANGWTVAEDVGRGLRARRQGEGEGQVPLRLGQGGGDLLPDPRHRLRDQGGRRRGAARAREPRAEVLVEAGDPVGVQRA